MTAGIANMTAIEMTSFSQSKMGMRFSVIPGARCRKIVVAIQMRDTERGDLVKVIICDQKSARCPGEKAGPERGT